MDDEAQLLREAGHQVKVWSPEPEAASVPAKAVLIGRMVWSRSARANVEDLIATWRPDVVHVHNLWPALSPSVLRAPVAGKPPIVMTLHNYRLMCLPGTFYRDGHICEDCLGHAPIPGVVHRCYQGSMGASAALASSLGVHRQARSFERITRFLAVSSWLRDRHVAGGLPPAKVVVKRNFSADRGRRRGPGDHFLYLGRLAQEKGVRSLLAGWSPPHGKLLIAGDGPELQKLKDEAPRDVEFLGTVDPRRASELLLSARALCIPSLWYEGEPRSILEAYSAGVPIIANGIGALPEVVRSEQTGILVPPGDTEAWSAALRRLGDDEESLRLGRGGRALWEEMYTPEKALASLEDVYGAVIAEASN